MLDETSPPAAPDRLIPRHDWKLGQSDRLTAGLLWAAVLSFGWGAVMLAAIFFPLVRGGPAAGAPLLLMFGSVAGLLLLSAVAVLVVLRMFTVSRQASYGRLSNLVKRRYPWARIRVREPWMRVAGANVLTGRRGFVALAPERAILVIDRVPTWAVGLGLGLALWGPSKFLDPLSATSLSTAMFLGSLALAFFTGADVHEIRYDDIEDVSAGDGRVQWAQGGRDAPRVIRFRVVNATDPGAASVWLTGPLESGVAAQRLSA